MQNPLARERRSQADGRYAGSSEQYGETAPAHRAPLEVAFRLDDEPRRAEQGIGTREPDTDQQSEQRERGTFLEARYDAGQHDTLCDRGNHRPDEEQAVPQLAVPAGC